MDQVPGPGGKVSVVIPTYNRDYCLAATLGSLQRQTYTNWEALVVDDGSTDETTALVTRLRRDDRRIRYHQQPNRGVSSARNAGLRLADGDWVAFLDSDDAWQPWKLSAQLACLERIPDVGMIWTDMDAVDEKGALVSRRHLRKMYGAYSSFGEDSMFERQCSFAELAPQLAAQHAELSAAKVRWGDLYSAMIVGNLVHTSTALLSRARLAAVGLFDERMRTGEDYDFHLRACRAGPVALLDACSIYYRVAGGHDQLTAAPYRVEIARNALRTRLAAIERDRSRISLSNGELRRIIAKANAWVAEELFGIESFSAARPYFYRGATHIWRKPRALAKALLTLFPASVAHRLLALGRRARR